MMQERGCCNECVEVLRALGRVLEKLHEDLVEALFRTPMHISSYAFIERSLRLARAGLQIALEASKRCSIRGYR